MFDSNGYWQQVTQNAVGATWKITVGQGWPIVVFSLLVWGLTYVTIRWWNGPAAMNAKIRSDLAGMFVLIVLFLAVFIYQFVSEPARMNQALISQIKTLSNEKSALDKADKDNERRIGLLKMHLTVIEDRYPWPIVTEEQRKTIYAALEGIKPRSVKIYFLEAIYARSNNFAYTFANAFRDRGWKVQLLPVSERDCEDCFGIILVRDNTNNRLPQDEQTILQALQDARLGYSVGIPAHLQGTDIDSTVFMIGGM